MEPEGEPDITRNAVHNAIIVELLAKMEMIRSVFSDYPGLNLIF
jgi:hypothetical protein